MHALFISILLGQTSRHLILRPFNRPNTNNSIWPTAFLINQTILLSVNLQHQVSRCSKFQTHLLSLLSCQIICQIPRFYVAFRKTYVYINLIHKPQAECLLRYSTYLQLYPVCGRVYTTRNLRSGRYMSRVAGKETLTFYSGLTTRARCVRPHDMSKRDTTSE